MKVTQVSEANRFDGPVQPYRLRNGDWAVVHDSGSTFSRGQRLSDGWTQIWNNDGNAQTLDGEPDPDRDLMRLLRPSTDEHARLQPAVARLRETWLAQQEMAT